MTISTFPAIRISTERLIVREFGPDDAAAVAELVAAREWDALPPEARMDAASLSDWLAHGASRFRTAGLGVRLLIQERAAGARVGSISLYNVDWRGGTAEVGFGVTTRVRRRGYVSEALTAVTDWALSDGGLRLVELLTDPENVAARRVAEKTGYVYRGRVPHPVAGDRMSLLFDRSRVR